MVKTKLLFITIILSTLMSACLPSNTMAIEISDECILPLYNIPFPVVTPKSMNAITTPQKEAHPRENWQMQDALPIPQSEVSYLGVRQRQRELWLVAPKSRKIFRYFIDTNQWKSYQAADWTIHTRDNLFIASDGAIWGAGIRFPDPAYSEKTYPFMSRFNDAADRFEYVEDASGFLQAPHSRLISNVVEDQSGLLWFFVEAGKNILVSFDVKTRQSQQHYVFKIAGGNPNIVLGQDGSLWFQDYANDEIVQYVPSAQETHTYKLYLVKPASAKAYFERAAYIFMDRSERLWFANYGWFDVSNRKMPEWHQVDESAVFVTDRGTPESQYVLGNQFSTYQSSNGWYWFTGVNGIVRLDLEKESWCLTTTGISEVVEDSDHNLWIAVFGHLYKYPLAQ